MMHVIRADEMAGQRQSSVLQTRPGQWPGGRCDNCEPILRQRIEQLCGTRQGNDTSFIFDFHLLDTQIFLLGVHLRGKGSDGFYAAAPVRLRDDFFRREIVCYSPLPPYTSDGRSGIDQYSIKIEKNCLATEKHHTG